MITPRHIRFDDNFQRMSQVQVRNNSANPIFIDSTSYDSSIMDVNFNEAVSFPFELNPSQNILLIIRFFNNFNTITGDSVKKILIYNSGSQPIDEIEVNISHFMQNKMTGTVEGFVNDSSSALEATNIYFFYDGVILSDSAKTDNTGYFSLELPVGRYLVSAEKEGYYMQFFNGQTDPLKAEFIIASNNSTISADFLLEPMLETEFSVTGTVGDEFPDLALRKAFVVVRRGEHNPSKISGFLADDTTESYATIANSRGEYQIKNIKRSGSYYIQAFSNFHIPGYYNKMNQPAVFWQDADSSMISSHVTGHDITLMWDSSYGGGMVRGMVHFANQQTSKAGNELVYAINESDNKPYTYGFISSTGDFGLANLPYGNYKLMLQRFGQEDIFSSSFEFTTEIGTVDNIDLTISTTSSEKEPELPNGYKLYQNYPNPFNPSTKINFNLAKRTHVKLSVFDLMGREIKVLVDDVKSPGKYETEFKSENIASGIYFYRIETSSFVSIKKMLLLK